MKRTTLLVMAAGMGSRFGGNKQIAPLGPNGEILMDYSIHDALLAGFNKVVFVIKPEMREAFHEVVGARVEKKVEIAYAYQTYDGLPSFFHVPEGRVKPYGTVQAVLCAKDALDSPFCVINADDYYGRGAFQTIHDALVNMQDEPGCSHACMVAYLLKNTVSENGAVTRGVCATTDGGLLESVTETYKIVPFADGTIRDTDKNPDGDVLDPDSLVSMNFWGFLPSFFSGAQTRFDSFLRGLPEGEMKKEMPLPELVDAMMRAGEMDVRVLKSHDTWIGVTYPEDRQTVMDALRGMHASGLYPKALVD